MILRRNGQAMGLNRSQRPANSLYYLCITRDKNGADHLSAPR